MADMDQSGQKLGKYTIVRKLGGGGMGNVYLARDTILDRLVAIKLLNPAIAADASFVERFQLEARALARLDHRAIVRVFNADWVENQLYLAMEYVEGGSLDMLLREERIRPYDWSLKLLEQVAAGIDYAHRLGMVHRDIKPANILIDREGQAQISDFGLVKDAEVSLTADGQRLGTPAYMAPEQIQGRDMGPAVDIYALGVVAFELFAGQAPFRGTLSAVFEGHLLREPPLIRQSNPAIPAGVQDVVNRALAKSPAERYPTAAAFTAELRAAFDSAVDAGDTLLDVDLAAQLPPSQPATLAESIPPAAAAPAERRSAAGRTSEERPAGRATARPRADEAPARERPRGGGFLSGLGFGAFGIGSAIVIGLLCLCGGAAFVYYYEDLVGTPVPTVPPGPAVLYAENFDVPAAQGFPEEFVPQGSIEYAQGGYQIRVDAAEWLFWGEAGRSFGDASISVDATNQSSIQVNEFGIICRYLDPNDFYYGFISSDGFYGIVRWFFGEFQFVSPAPTGPSPQIRPGNATNQIRLDCDGSAMRLWVNGGLLAQASGVETRTGDAGVIAHAPIQGGVIVLFDNFVVTEVER